MVSMKKTAPTKRPKPILKWAGGKTQLLDALLPLVPEKYGKYIEPFFGGGALYFALSPKKAIVADSNPELINLYKQIVENLDGVLAELKAYKNEEDFFYRVRALDWRSLPPHVAAARTIYLNKTCFNGLFRVNRSGQFNTPFGRYRKPNICDEETLRLASEALRSATIVCGDYRDVLREFAKKGDFVFLDPPYVPVGKWGDFKRYTKEQFSDEDQKDLAAEVDRLVNLGCYVVLTNSNHPLVHELYAKYEIKVVPTKRAISSSSGTRTGEDVIVVGKKSSATSSLNPQIKKYPPTRFMGSKQKLLDEIWRQASRFKFSTVLDLFSGSGVVGYMFKAQGKSVIANDYLHMSATFTKAMLENNSVLLTDTDIDELLSERGETNRFVETTFSGLYYSDEDNHLIDVIRSNIDHLSDEFKKAIAMTALIRACMKKRPRGLFTYTGDRYDDGRKDLKLSLAEQFRKNAYAVNQAVFDNGQNNVSLNLDSLQVDKKADLVYIDPPYFTPGSDNEYVRRYHFVEGLARGWQGVEIQKHTSTKKFKNYPTPFSNRNGAYDAFDRLFAKYRDSILIVSYSSNSFPSKEEMIAILEKYKKHVEVIPINYTYFFGNQTKKEGGRSHVQEYLFVAY